MSNFKGILDPGFDLSLRPMKYPVFFEDFRAAQKNNWTVQEISFNTDIEHLRDRLTPAERHVVSRIVAFFATGDNIVANNACLSLYKHVNSPEYRMYMGRQIFEETVHIEFYLTLLDEYVPDMAERAAMFQAVENVPSVKRKADFCFKWMDQMDNIDWCDTDEKKRVFLMNLITFASAVEGMFFFAAFAYVYYLRSKGYLHGLASGTNWVFRDESFHMEVAFKVIDIVRHEYPQLWDDQMESQVRDMLQEAIDCELQFADDVLELGVAGFTKADMQEYLQYCADQRLARLGFKKRYGSKNPFSFMELQDVAENTNFFERTVSAYQTGLSGEVSFDNDDF